MMTQLELQNILYPPSPPTLDEERSITTVSSQETIATLHTESTINTTLTINTATTTETNSFVPGKFEYVECTHTREMLANAWQAINLTETWDFVRMPIESFMMSRDGRIWVITAKMEDLGYNGHSGCSFGWTLRQMQFIAQYGEVRFRETYLESQQA
jgi:hypothetical protein